MTQQLGKGFVDKRIQAALEAVWEIFDNSGREMPHDKGRAYAMALGELSVDEVEQACLLAMRQCKWFPKPVELIELVRGDDDLEAERAWALVVTAIENSGAYQSVQFADPRISRAISNNGGWRKFCETDETWSRKSFIATFKTLPKTCFPARCQGIHDQNNGEYRPTLVGPGQPRIENQQNEIVSGLAKRIEESKPVSSKQRKAARSIR